ncbi:MAG: ABC transporter ATP-binding protein, partial [Elusimicrobia bacterium]|nr:ABC transporter ATP-binding protein [Elusimicrobiota bacterium]
MSETASAAEGWRARLRDFRQALENAPRAFSLLWDADRGSTLVLAILTLVGSALPVSQAWVTKLIIDGVVSALQRRTAPEQAFVEILPYLLLELALLTAGAVNGQVRTLVEKLINHRLGHLINTRIVRKALSLEMRYFEDPDFYDRMQKARKQSEWRAMGVVHAAFLIVQNALTLLSFIAVLLSFNAWVAVGLLAAAIPAFVVRCRYSALSFRLESWRTPETRSMAYLEHVLTQDSSVKEVKLYGLGEPLLARYDGIFRRIFGEDAALAKSRSIKSVSWGLLATLSHSAAYAWVIYQTVAGRLTLGEMTLYMTVFGQSQGAFNGLLDDIASLYENGLFLDNLFSFLGLDSGVRVRPRRERPAEDPSRGIEFRGVWFRYPGREDWALRDFSLAVGP